MLAREELGPVPTTHAVTRDFPQRLERKELNSLY